MLFDLLAGTKELQHFSMKKETYNFRVGMEFGSVSFVHL